MFKLIYYLVSKLIKVNKSMFQNWTPFSLLKKNLDLKDLYFVFITVKVSPWILGNFDLQNQV